MLPRALLFLTALVALVAVWVFTLVSKHFEAVAAGVMPLESRRFEELTLVTVGSGGTFENHRRLGPAIAVGRGEALLLVDAGRAVAEALRAAGIPVPQPAAVLLTSLLPENVVGLDDLILTRTHAFPEAPLQVLGPPGTRALVAGILELHGAATPPALADFAAPPAARGRDLAEASRFELEGFRVDARPLPGGPLPALAYRVEADGRSVLLSSSGWAPEILVEHGRGARAWVHEALYRGALEAALEHGAERPEALGREAALHTALEDIGDLATRMGVRSLVLTRLRPPPVYDIQYRRLVGRSFRGHIVVASDGEEIVP